MSASRVGPGIDTTYNPRHSLKPNPESVDPAFSELGRIVTF